MFPVKVIECLITVLINGNIMIKIKISFLFAFLGLVLVKSAIVLQACHRQNYIKCLPLLVVQPYLSAQLLASILRLFMTAQCELFYRC